jgi:hypothetical protein
MESKKNKPTLAAGLFASEGWKLEGGLLDPVTVTDVRRFLETRCKELQASFEQWVGDKISNVDAYIWHQGRLPSYDSMEIPADLRHYLVGEFDLSTRLDPIVRRVLSDAHCRTVISRFLKSAQYYVHYPPTLRFKVKDASASIVPPHQDAAYNEHIDDFVTVWIPFVDIDEACGGVIVYEGSHLDRPVKHSRGDIWAAQAQSDLSKYVGRHVTMRAGDGLLFPPTLLHASAPHRAAVMRVSLDFRVFWHTSQTTKSYYNPFNHTITRAG